MAMTVVEDDDDARQILLQIFQFAGATVTTCAHAYAALDALNGGLHPDIIVSDLALPRMDGLTFMQAVRSHSDPTIQRTPIIAITAHYELYGPEELLKLGCQAYMVKPLSLDRVCSAVQKLVGAQHKRILKQAG